MAYTKFNADWKAHPDTSTPITEAALDHIETGIFNAAATADSALAAAGAPTGAIMDYGGSSAPSGWVLCNGSAISRTTFSALFAVIGTTYGAGDGSTTFNVPDLRGRVSVGLGSHADVNALGDNDGSALADRRPKHKHTVNESNHTHSVNDPGHVHNIDRAPATGAQNAYARGSTPDGFHASLSATTGISIASANTGLTVGPQTTSPTDGAAFLTVQKIIKT